MRGNSKRQAAGHGETLIRVRLTPRSSRDEVLGLEDGVFRIKLTAPPVEGKANKALVTFLSKALRIPRSAVAILSGGKSREKTLSIQGVSAQDVKKGLTGTA
ncbi:MAG: DUF167 domain-containing protein [Deltaproteobacteria bacterium]|nr:DUF167 domain-containing protein [Deltaproteobacteria bacterium]